MMVTNGSHWFPKISAVIVSLASIIVLLTPPVGSTVTHIVGDSVWSIPQTEGFYNNWAASRLFRPGDVLYFEFDPDIYHVMRVQYWEYQICETNIVIPWEVYDEGKVWITLTEELVHTYVCNIFDYCSLGLKLELRVNKSA